MYILLQYHIKVLHLEYICKTFIQYCNSSNLGGFTHSTNKPLLSTYYVLEFRNYRVNETQTLALFKDSQFRAQVANPRPAGQNWPSTLFYPALAPCFYLAAAPSSLPLVKE